MERRIEGQRLAYYKKTADAVYWDNHWHDQDAAKIYQWAEKGELFQFEEPFITYLPKRGRILEAGCGLGQMVMALRIRGYDCEGVEWAAQTVTKTHQLYPDLPIWIGDVTRLAKPTGHYKGYISLGVVEHRQAGPEPFLREAYRVLTDDGALLLSVPHLHSLRRYKASWGLYQGRTEDRSFYQYAFTPEEMGKILASEGFKVIDLFGLGGYKGFKDEVPGLRDIVRWRLVGGTLRVSLRHWKWFNQTFGHMMMFVCRKL